MRFETGIRNRIAVSSAIVSTPARCVRSGRIVLRLVPLLLALAVLPGLSRAEDGPARKLGRGAANLGLGVFAIPSEIIDTTRRSGPALGVTWGLVKGSGIMVATEIVGLWEIMTCPFATPPDYRPILDPEFPWQRFTSREGRDGARRAGTATAGGRRVRD